MGKGDISIAAQVLDENVQVTTGLKPDSPSNGREEYKRIFSAFYDAFPPIPGSEMTIEDLFAAGDRLD